MIANARRQLAAHVDEAQIAAAIKAAEAQTTGRLYVAIAPHFWGSERRAAELAFEQFQHAHSAHRNTVFFFVVPSRRQLVVLGDEAIDQRVGQAFWDQLAVSTSTQIKTSDLTSGLVYGIGTAGRELARHFPKRKKDQSVN